MKFVIVERVANFWTCFRLCFLEPQKSVCYNKCNEGTEIGNNRHKRDSTMYDKIKLWMNGIFDVARQDVLASCLADVTTQIKHGTGEVRTYGRLGGLKVAFYAGGLCIEGSLPKYLYGGSNVYPLDRHTTADVVTKISDDLHLDISAADVRSLEFGTIFPMKHRVSDYLDRLGDMPRLVRSFYASTTPSLYYTGNGRRQTKVFTFYDKGAEAKAKRMDCPTSLENLLRYEMRLNGYLCRQLREPEVKASTLYKLSFYSNVMRLYQESYYSIKKMRQMKTGAISEIQSVGDAYDILFSRLLRQNPAEADEFINELKRAGVFKDRKYYTRLKYKLQSVANKTGISVTDELIRELDNDIRNCGAYV